MIRSAIAVLAVMLLAPSLPMPATAQIPEVQIADFGVRGGEGSIPCPVPFTIAGESGSYKKGQTPQPLNPNLYFYLYGDFETDDQIVITGYNSAGAKIGTQQFEVGRQSSADNKWSWQQRTCDKINLPKVGSYVLDITLVNKATGRNIALKKAKLPVEEIADRGGDMHLVPCSDCHLREGWLNNQNGDLDIIFFVKAKGERIVPKVRIYRDGQQIGEPKSCEEPSSLTFSAQGIVCYTQIKYDEMLAQDGKWEAKVALNGEPARVLKWSVEGGKLSYHHQQPEDRSTPGRLLADSRFVEAEVLQCPVEGKWNPELIKWPNMFFGRKPVGNPTD